MDGLEAVEINVSECKAIIDFRIDANTYKKNYVMTDKHLKELFSTPIENKILSIQNFGAYSLCNNINFTEAGIPFLMTQNIRHNYIEWSNIAYIDEASHQLLYKSHCKKGQVLITMAGEYLGRAAVYDKDFMCSSNQAIAKITLLNESEAYYISTFLNTRYGQNQINRLKTITGQPNINMGLIKSLLIPPFSDAFYSHISNLVKESELNIVNADSIYHNAEQLLLSQLCMDDFSPSLSAVSVKQLSESFLESGRLDAEYYQPKYDIFFDTLKTFDCCPLGKIVTIKKSIEPGSAYYGDEGIPFVRVSNVTKYGLSKPEIKLPYDVVANPSKFYPKKDTILLSKDGSIGIAFNVEEDLRVITSGALLHLNIIDKNEILPEYLTLVLNSIIVQLQAERDASGAIIQHWKLSEVEAIAIPILDNKTQMEIAQNVQLSFTLRHQSEQLLENAKKAVEIAIEQGEEAATAWLDEVIV